MFLALVEGLSLGVELFFTPVVEKVFCMLKFPVCAFLESLSTSIQLHHGRSEPREKRNSLLSGFIRQSICNGHKAFPAGRWSLPPASDNKNLIPSPCAFIDLSIVSRVGPKRLFLVSINFLSKSDIFLFYHLHGKPSQNVGGFQVRFASEQRSNVKFKKKKKKEKKKKKRRKKLFGTFLTAVCKAIGRGWNPEATLYCPVFANLWRLTKVPDWFASNSKEDKGPRLLHHTKSRGLFIDWTRILNSGVWLFWILAMQILTRLFTCFIVYDLD